MATLLISYGADVNQLVIEEGMPPRNILTEAEDCEDEEMIDFCVPRVQSCLTNSWSPENGFCDEQTHQLERWRQLRSVSMSEPFSITDP